MDYSGTSILQNSNEVLGITNDSLWPSNSKMYEKKEENLDLMKPRYSKQILSVSWPLLYLCSTCKCLHSVSVMTLLLC